MKARTGWIVATATAVVAAAGGTTAVLAFTDDELGPQLVLGSTQEALSLDPAGAYDAGSADVQYSLYQRLLTFNPGDVTPQPDIAESCDFIGGDTTQYACDLRTDLTFSNGSELTSEDVKWSIERTKKLGGESQINSLLSTVESVAAPSPDRVVFTLNAPDVKFPMKLTTPAGLVMSSEDNPADRLISGKAKPVGSGPYVVEDANLKNLSLRRNPRYAYAEDVMNDGVRRVYYADRAKAAAALEKGTVDALDGKLEPKDINRFTSPTSDSGIRANEGLAPDARILGFNVRKEGVSEKGVRQAAAYLLARETLAREAQQNTVEPLYSLIPKGITTHRTPFFERYQATDRVAAARAAMQEAGVTAPVPLSIMFAENTPEAETSELERQLEEGGLFEVTLDQVPFGEVVNAFGKGDYQAFLLGWQADYPDPDTFTAALLKGGGFFNTGYTDPKLEKELIPATLEHAADTPEALEAFTEIQRISAENAVLLPVTQSKRYVFTQDDVLGGEKSTDTSGTYRYWMLEKIESEEE